MTILVIAEHNQKELSAATFSTLSAGKILAQKTSSELHVLVCGKAIQSVCEQIAKCAGIAQVLKAQSDDFVHLSAETLSAIVIQHASNYTHILASATTEGKNFLPRVAAKLDVQPLSDIIEIIEEDTFVRPIYAGNAIATVQSIDPIKVLTIRNTAFDAANQTGGNADIISIELKAVIFERTHFISQELTVSERPELTAANIVISGGRGMQSGDNFQLLEGIADQLNAAVGASRAAVDAGFVPNDYQVGQTGKIVAPDLYIAVGISGAIQHLAGMKDSKVIVAINKDEEAPIFQIADYGLVGDLFKILPELNEALKA
jgi:electron transfer flavoprotein alpha subunit